MLLKINTGKNGRSGKHAAEAAELLEVRSAVTKFLTAGFLALILVATPVAFWVRAEAERHALVNATEMTQRLADNAVSPMITAGFLAREPGAVDALDRRLTPWLASGQLMRIKVWDEGGRVIYSDVDSLIGQVFEQEEWARLLLQGGPATATLESQTAAENEFEADSGELVEVYVRSVSQAGTPVVVEAYYTGSGVRNEQESVLVGMVPPMLLSLAALQLAQLIPAVRLARRIQRDQAARHGLLRCAIEASDQERRQIAGELHDEVIQNLSALAYALESEERRGAPAQRPVFEKARTMLQENIRTIRAMTTELYPPDLEELGLKASLLRLESALMERGIALQLEVPDKLTMDRDRVALAYRVVREALVNVAKHSAAQTVQVQVVQLQQCTRITVADDGKGFDVSESRKDGHFGLRILGDTIRQAGGSFEVFSTPGVGTTIVATLGSLAPSAPWGGYQAMVSRGRLSAKQPVT